MSYDGHPLSVADQVAERLHEAGITLASLPMSGHSLACRTHWPDIVRELFADEPPEIEIRAPRPSPSQIDRMDETFRWLGFLPLMPNRLRHVVLRRLIIHPISHRYRHSWRKIGRELGCDDKTAKSWHADAVAVIARNLREPQFFSSQIPQYEACQ